MCWDGAQDEKCSVKSVVLFGHTSCERSVEAMVMMMNGSHKLCVCKSDVSNLKAKGLKEKKKNPALHHTYFGILLPTPPPPPPRSKQEGQRGEGDGFFFFGGGDALLNLTLPPYLPSPFLTF